MPTIGGFIPEGSEREAVIDEDDADVTVME
jgi:hypothetical protein